MPDDVRISLAIMHLTTNPLRRAMVAGQIKTLGGPDALGRETEYWEVTKDILGVGPWPTARRGWLAAARAPEATHHILIQDDATLCRDLIPGLKKALACIPPAAVSLFNNRPAAIEARNSGKSWIALPGGVHGMAIVLPSAWALEFVRWADANVPTDYMHDDRRLSLWIMQHEKLSLGTVPSLVDHGGAADSTLGHNDASYVAKWFIGHDASPLDIDWTKGADSPVMSRAHFTLAARWLDVHKADERRSVKKKARAEAALDPHRRARKVG